MRLHPSRTLLCVIDIQERLLAAMPTATVLVSRAMRLAQAALLLNVKSVLTEQYPKGLGSTPGMLAEKMPPPMAKMSFSCCGSEEFNRSVDPTIETVVLCGLETHVCIAQTAIDLLGRGLGVFIVVDAVASRYAIDHETALQRLQSQGAILTTSEAVLFEWCGSAEHQYFQAIRTLVK